MPVALSDSKNVRSGSGTKRGVLAFLFLSLLTAIAPAQPSTPDATTHATMQKFVIIFHQDSRTLTDSDKQLRQQQVSAWARTQNAAGHKLEPRILGPETARPGDLGVATGNAILKSTITALLFLEAADLSDAAKVAETHPALHFGSTVEVRPWSTPVPSKVL